MPTKNGNMNGGIGTIVVLLIRRGFKLLRGMDSIAATNTASAPMPTELATNSATNAKAILLKLALQIKQNVELGLSRQRVYAHLLHRLANRVVYVSLSSSDSTRQIDSMHNPQLAARQRREQILTRIIANVVACPSHHPSPPTANVQLPQLREAASLDRLEQNHEALRLDVVARDVQVLQLHHGVEQDGVADEANALVAHLDAYCSPATHNRTVQHQMLDRVHRVLAEVAEQRRHSLVADAVASKTQVLQMRRVGVVDGRCEEENTLVVDLVVLQVQDLQRRHLPVRPRSAWRASSDRAT